MPSVLIIDGSLLIRQGLRKVLNDEYRDVVFGEAKKGEEVLAQVTKRSWDLIILDIDLPDHTLQEIRQNAPSARVLAMGMRADSWQAARARQMGAAGYVSKNATRVALLRAVRQAFTDEKHGVGFPLPNDGMAIPLERRSLSPREYNVMLALGNGKRPTDIALELHLSVKTVSTYKRRVLNKLRLNSMADLVRHVVEHKFP